jgi:hypothetical protein
MQSAAGGLELVIVGILFVLAAAAIGSYTLLLDQ